MTETAERTIDRIERALSALYDGAEHVEHSETFHPLTESGVSVPRTKRELCDALKRLSSMTETKKQRKETQDKSEDTFSAAKLDEALNCIDSRIQQHLSTALRPLFPNASTAVPQLLEYHVALEKLARIIRCVNQELDLMHPVEFHIEYENPSMTSSSAAQISLGSTCPSLCFALVIDSKPGEARSHFTSVNAVFLFGEQQWSHPEIDAEVLKLLNRGDFDVFKQKLRSLLIFEDEAARSNNASLVSSLASLRTSIELEMQAISQVHHQLEGPSMSFLSTPRRTWTITFDRILLIDGELHYVFRTDPILSTFDEAAHLCTSFTQEDTTMEPRRSDQVHDGKTYFECLYGLRTCHEAMQDFNGVIYACRVDKEHQTVDRGVSITHIPIPATSFKRDLPILVQQLRRMAQFQDAVLQCCGPSVQAQKDAVPCEVAITASKEIGLTLPLKNGKLGSIQLLFHPDALIVKVKGRKSTKASSIFSETNSIADVLQSI